MEMEFLDVAIEVFLAVVILIPLWVIAKKAGFHPTLSLMIFIPVLGYIVIAMVLAFGTWRTVEERS